MIRALFTYASILVRTVPALFRTQHDQAIVELALRQQLAVYAQKRARPRLTPADRAFRIALVRFWPRWKSALVIVRPETVIRWHRKGFRLYWRWRSKPGPGRPRISAEVQKLIRRMATDNPCRARRVKAELEKLWIRVSLATASRYLPKRAPDRDHRQRWRTFLMNYKDRIDALDFLVVPTACCKLLHVWFAIGHSRREILHINVTPHPTAAWVVQQLRETFADDASVQYLIHDNDAIFSDWVDKSIASFGIEPKRTAVRSPWQNGIAERWIGTLKRDLPDHVIVFDERHLRRLLREYVACYNAERVHTVLRGAPTGRRIEKRPFPSSRVVGRSRLGGLHHRYEWQNAA